MKKKPQIREETLELFRSRGGILKFSEALQNGIDPRILKELLKEGSIEKCERGLYVLKNFEGISQPDLVIIAKKIPKGVICLLSSLHFHHLTLQIPRQVDIALEHSDKIKRISHPPVKFYWFSKKYYELGIEKHNLDGVEIKVYCPEKTIVDCFRFPKKIPLSVSIEALKTAYYENKLDINKLLRFAETERVLNTMKPYLETIIHEQS
jgi:predicted transcriptional regulator of viral defense system